MLVPGTRKKVVETAETAKTAETTGVSKNGKESEDKYPENLA